MDDPNGDRRARLERLRDQLEVAIGSAEANMLPQLAGQYRATLADLAALPAVVIAVKPGSKDDLKDRRARRVAAAKASTSPKRARK